MREPFLKGRSVTGASAPPGRGPAPCRSAGTAPLAGALAKLSRDDAVLERRVCVRGQRVSTKRSDRRRIALRSPSLRVPRWSVVILHAPRGLATYMSPVGHLGDTNLRHGPRCSA